MTKIEEAAKKYAKKEWGHEEDEIILMNHMDYVKIEVSKEDFLVGATHVQETELKEARELIEDLLAKLQRTKHNLSAYEESSVVSFLSSVNETITKAETFLNK